MEKMNPEAKAKIVEALRSGDYKQGQGALNEKGCHCVWGVICDVSGTDEWVVANPEQGTMRYGVGGDICFPELKVREWVGLDKDPSVLIRNVRTDLMSQNDNGATFAELADAIEQQL